MISRCNSPRKPQRKPKPRAAEAQFAHRRAQSFKIVGVDRKQPAEHHRDGRLETRQHLGDRLLVVGDGVAHPGVGHFLDRGRDKADFAGAEFFDLLHLRREEAGALDLIGGVGAHHADALALFQHAVDDANQHHHAEIDVVPAVDQKRLQRGVAVAGRRRQPVHDGFEHLVDAKTGFCRDHNRFGSVDADHVLDLLLDLVRFRRRQVDLVEDGDDLVTGIERMIDIGQRLRLDALAGIDHQKRTLAGRQRARHLVGEVNVAGGVDQVENVGLAVPRRIGQPYRLRLDGDAALALDIHGIEHLFLHLARGKPPGGLDQAVGQRRFAMVDMRNDGKVADIGNRAGCHRRGIALAPRCGNHIAAFTGTTSRQADSTSGQNALRHRP
jgi:hypothetical protein